MSFDAQLLVSSICMYFLWVQRNSVKAIGVSWKPRSEKVRKKAIEFPILCWETSNQFWLHGIFIREFFHFTILFTISIRSKNANKIFSRPYLIVVYWIYCFYHAWRTAFYDRLSKYTLAVNIDLVLREGRHFRLFIAKKISNIPHGISAIWQLLKVVV